MAGLRDALLDALAVLFPVECAGCGTPDRALCGACRPWFEPDPVVQRLPGGTPVHSALRYEGVVRAVILAFKEHNRTDVAADLAAPLSTVLSSVLGASLAGASTGDPQPEVAPIRGSRAGYRRRGYDPVAVLLRRVGWTQSRVLGRPAAAPPQKQLDRAQRAGNRAGGFRARGRLDGRRFVIVDDVVTTGATLADAARAIREAGGTVVAAVALAYTPKRGPLRTWPRWDDPARHGPGPDTQGIPGDIGGVGD